MVYLTGIIIMYLKVLCCVLLASVTVTECTEQGTINYLANNLEVTWTVTEQYDWEAGKTTQYKANLQLKNAGDEEIAAGGSWGIYFCHVRLLFPVVLRPKNNNGTYLGNTGLRVDHIGGCFHSIKPTSSFAGFTPNQVINEDILVADWQVARTDNSPNWYVVGETPGTEPRTISSTAGEDLEWVADFTTKKQWKRQTDDKYDPFSSGDRYNRNTATDSGKAEKWVIPTPAHVSVNEDVRVSIDKGNWQIYHADVNLTRTASIFSDKLSLPVTNTKPQGRYIELSIGEVKDLDNKIVENDEAYRVDVMVMDEMIIVVGKTNAGVYYGMETLVSLHQHDGQGVPNATIVDFPRFAYRGMFADVCRNFKSKAEILELLGAMAMYKLNKFHFHLSDDEGWRLEIPGLEEMTEVGSRRCHDLEERTCLWPQLGSGPLSGDSGTGYYTAEEYKEILEFAADRHIEVIPEFDTPGHGHAPIKAMEARYHRYNATDPDKAEEYLLSDPDDMSEYLSVQYFRDNGINPCLNSTYTWLNKVVSEVKKMHDGINELKIFHFGGDEVPTGAWEGSPACQERYPNATKVDLLEMFAYETAKVVASYGLDLAAWEDGLMRSHSQAYNKTNFPEGMDVYGCTWNNIWEWDGKSAAHILANNDYKVILAHATHNYFDHPYEPDPEERGFYWATRMTPINETFGYIPDDVYANIEWKRMGNWTSRDDICKDDKDCVPLQEGKTGNVVGLQGLLWSETVRTKSQFNYMIFPRLLALAERAWHKSDWESNTDDITKRNKDRADEWSQFANTLGYKELRRLSDLGIDYRVPPPGVTVTDKNKLNVNVETPGLPIQYSEDNRVTWKDIKAGTNTAVVYDRRVYVRTRSADNSRTSRVVHVDTEKAPVVAAASTVNYELVFTTLSLCIGMLMA